MFQETEVSVCNSYMRACVRVCMWLSLSTSPDLFFVLFCFVFIPSLPPPPSLPTQGARLRVTRTAMCGAALQTCCALATCVALPCSLWLIRAAVRAALRGSSSVPVVGLKARRCGHVKAMPFAPALALLGQPGAITTAMQSVHLPPPLPSLSRMGKKRGGGCQKCFTKPTRKNSKTLPHTQQTQHNQTTHNTHTHN